MIHQVFLNALNHNFFHLSTVNLLIVDECHHTIGKSAYKQIFDGHYFRLKVNFILICKGFLGPEALACVMLKVCLLMDNYSD